MEFVKRAERNIMPKQSLDNLPLYQSGEIIAIDGDETIKNKLKSMGILVGLTVTVLKRHQRTPSIIQIGEAKLAVGRTIMQAIQVKAR